jgi:hypothetical protein
MSRIAFQDINVLPDFLDQVAYEFVLGVIPGAGDSRRLTLHTQQVSIPGAGNEAWEVLLHGHAFRQRGRKTFPRQLSVTFIEGGDLAVYNILKAWDEYIAGSESGNSATYKAGYVITAFLNIYDTVGNIAGIIRFDNFFLQEISDIQLDGTSSGQVAVSVTFSYDRAVNGRTALR